MLHKTPLILKNKRILQLLLKTLLTPHMYELHVLNLTYRGQIIVLFAKSQLVVGYPRK